MKPEFFVRKYTFIVRIWYKTFYSKYCIEVFEVFLSNTLVNTGIKTKLMFGAFQW